MEEHFIKIFLTEILSVIFLKTISAVKKKSPDIEKETIILNCFINYYVYHLTVTAF